MLVERDGQQFIIKETWEDVQHQWQECEFLQLCKDYKIQNVAHLVNMENISTDSTCLCQANTMGVEEVEECVHCQLVL